MRSDFIPSDIQDASERRRQPTAAFAASTAPTEAFATFLMDPRELAQSKTQAQMVSQVAAAPPGPPVSPFKGISAFAGSPAVIPSAVVPPVDTLTEPVAAPSASQAPASFAAPVPTAAEIAPAATTPEAPGVTPSPAAAPAINTLSQRREPIPYFSAAKSEAAPAGASAAAPTELVKGNAAFGARAVTAEESLALANDDKSATPQGPKLFGEEGMTVADFFSIINPLQHIPVLGALYREVTGDTIKPGGRVLGGMLFGGPMGMVGGAFNAAVENDIGTDPGGAFLALVQGKPIGSAAAASANLANAPRPTPAATAPTAAVSAETSATAPAAAPVAPLSVVAEAPIAAPLAPSQPRVASPVKPSVPASAEARIIPSTPAPAVAAAAPAEAAKPVIPVSFSAAPAAPAAADAKAGFAISPAGKEFPVPARMNNVQPRQPVPVVRADLSRARELAPMAPMTARPEAPRPDRSLAPASLLTPGLSPAANAAAGLPSATSLSPVSSAPLGVPGLPASALPDAMTRALDKYDALLKSRKGGVLNQQS